MSEPVTEVSTQIFSIDCFLDSRTNDTIDTTNENILNNTYYIKLLLMAIFPFIIGITCYTVWYVIGRVKKNLSLVNSRAISSIIIVLFMIHPNICQYMFSIFK